MYMARIVSRIQLASKLTWKPRGARSEDYYLLHGALYELLCWFPLGFVGRKVELATARKLQILKSTHVFQESLLQEGSLSHVGSCAPYGRTAI